MRALTRSKEEIMKKVFQCQEKTTVQPNCWYVLYSGTKKKAEEFKVAFAVNPGTLAIRVVAREAFK